MFNIPLYHISWKNMVQVSFEPSDWLFTKTAVTFERIEIWSHMRAHFLAFQSLFPTVYHTWEFKRDFKFSKFGSRDRWRHSSDTWPALIFVFSRERSQINFWKSYWKADEGNDYCGSTRGKISRGALKPPPPGRNRVKGDFVDNQVYLGD